jgi:hypothetical protein
MKSYTHCYASVQFMTARYRTRFHLRDLQDAKRPTTLHNIGRRHALPVPCKCRQEIHWLPSLYCPFDCSLSCKPLVRSKSSKYTQDGLRNICSSFSGRRATSLHEADEGVATSVGRGFSGVRAESRLVYRSCMDCGSYMPLSQCGSVDSKIKK